MLGYYVGIAHKDRNSAYGIYFPDVPGCFGADDDSVEGAVANAAQALVFHIGSDTPPAARALDDILGDPEVRKDIEAGGTPVLVPLLLRSGATKKVNFTIDENTLGLIDGRAKLLGLTRSSFLAEAARRMVANG